MTPDRFRQIEDLFHAAREGSAEERVALLARADPDLRREVESLLIGADGGEFLDRPAVQNTPRPDENATVVQLVAGARLGPYRIESRLGEGGMGEVFRAIDTRLGRAVAIKTTREQFSARFEREARAISSLNHPNICTLHDVGPDYLVMELVEGETIASILKRGAIPLKAALRYASQILEALAEAHGKGVVHRDLKPENIMIAKSGVKVLDFGLAKSGQDETITASHMVMGTPGYMAPEQREGKPADERSDIYSFGCVLYEMLTGSRITSQRKRLPARKLERIVSRCVEEDPARRWQSVVELKRALESVGTGDRAWKLVSAAAVVLAMMAAAYFYYFHRPRTLAEQDTVVLADFVNNTGDPIFDSTLRQGLAFQLEHSPFLKVMDDDQVRHDLRLMQLPPGARITDQIAHDICVREGAAAIIAGAIASLGKSYALTLKATTCQDSRTLARQQIQGPDKEHILSALNAAATGIRAKLGESLDSIKRQNGPMEEATTSSLEALQNYAAGRSELGQGRSLSAVRFFQRATELDPKFASAYYRLGVGYEVAGDMARSAANAKKAYAMIDRVSEYERAEITPYYYRATGEVDKEIDAWKQATREYPRNWVYHNQLALIYDDDGQYEDGLNEAAEAIRLGADSEAPYRRQLDAYICLDRLPEARKLADELRTRKIGGSRIHQRFLEMAYVADDTAGIATEIQWLTGKPEEYLSFGLQAAYRNVHGQRRESHKLYQRAAEMARRRDLESVAVEFEDADARADAIVENCQTARLQGRSALALALCGERVRAEKLTAETSRLLPKGTIWNAVQLPEIRAVTALNRNQPEASLDLLASASPYERSYIEANYFRGLAYLRLRKGPEAIAEFQKIVDHKGASWGATWVHPNWGLYYAPSQLELARAYSLAGDTAKAKTAFQSFFQLWKNADSELAILKQAKAEYLKLP
jgi:serine/threonine protein kinase/tetratricopeptide (TPR) repeat protein